MMCIDIVRTHFLSVCTKKEQNQYDAEYVLNTSLLLFIFILYTPNY